MSPPANQRSEQHQPDDKNRKCRPQWASTGGRRGQRPVEGKGPDERQRDPVRDHELARVRNNASAT